MSDTAILGNIPASQALHLSTEAFTGNPPAADWKHPLAGPWKAGLQQIEDNTLSTDTCQFASWEHSLWRSLPPSADHTQ